MCICVAAHGLLDCCTIEGVMIVMNSLQHHALLTIRVGHGSRRVDYRVKNYLPKLMRDAGVEFWVLSQREYHEDVAWRSVASPTSINVGSSPVACPVAQSSSYHPHQSHRTRSP